jgi:hypothetical protein
MGVWAFRTATQIWLGRLNIDPIESYLTFLREIRDAVAERDARDDRAVDD